MTVLIYNPADANLLLPDGDYDAVILSAEVGEAKNGEPKLVVNLKAYGPDSKQPLVHDNIVAPWGLRRLKQLCEVVGVDFKQGGVDPKGLVGQNVRVQLVIQRDGTGVYDDANRVRKYLLDVAAPTPKPTAVGGNGPSGSPQKTGGVGRAEACRGYCESVRKERPDVGAALLDKNFKSACEGLIEGRSESDFTEADWIEVRDEGPAEFLRF